MSFDKNKHLREVLDTHKMCHVQDFVNKVKKRREEVKAKMHNHYGSDKYPSFESGSFAKHTATNVKFDIDLEDLENAIEYFYFRRSRCIWKINTDGSC